MPNVLVFAEAREGVLRKVALEAVTAARTLVDGSGGGEVHALLVGAAGVESRAQALSDHGADVVIIVEHPAFERFNPEACTTLVAERLRGGAYLACLFSSSVQGRDLAARVAGRAGLPVVTDVTALTLDADALVVTHPIDTNKVIAT